MKRSGILAILCLAFGAVRAEAQSQPAINLLVQGGPVISGGSHPCLLQLQNVPVGSDLYFICGTPGTSNVTLGTQTFAIPLARTTVLTHTTARGPVWFGRIAVPDDPSLIGWTPTLTAAAVMPNGAFCVAPLVPFGPIIEDSIQ